MRSEVVPSFDDAFKNRLPQSLIKINTKVYVNALVSFYVLRVVFARRRDATRVRLDDTYHTYTP